MDRFAAVTCLILANRCFKLSIYVQFELPGCLVWLQIICESAVYEVMRAGKTGCYTAAK